MKYTNSVVFRWLSSMALVANAFQSQSTVPTNRIIAGGSPVLGAATLDSFETALVNGESPTTTTTPSAPLTQSTAASTPAEREATQFRCDPSVEFWRTFQTTPSDAPELMRSIIAPYLLPSQTGNRKNSSSNINAEATATAARAYWIYHVVRSGYFSSNAVVGTLAHVFHERVVRRSDAVAPIFGDGFAGDSGAVARLTLLLAETVLCFQQDWNLIDNGVLNYPWDAALQADLKNGSSNNGGSGVRLQLDHKQSNPLFFAQETSRLVRESIGIWGRRMALAGTSSGVWLSTGNDKTKYPSYYLNDFHYQTDGWLSSESAQTYEVSTETLFLGRQDAMQRQTLVPIKKAFLTPPSSILEVACGTGRHATFCRDNFPRAQMTLVDLSPFYLEKARENDAYWSKYRGAQAMKLSSTISQDSNNNNNVNDAPPHATRFVQANAETLPFPDDSFDAVTVVYLFHELPPSARANVAAELSRVCRPGGMVVFSDSLQTGDRPPLDDQLENFTALNEPYYATYLKEDLPALFEQHGMKCSEKYMNSRTKTLSFVKDKQ